MSESPQPDGLDFDHADMAPEATGMSCGACGAAIAATYYGWGSTHVCPPCHERLSAEVRTPSFWRMIEDVLATVL